MSQLQVTGEAKIRDIQGPVVANDGVITALDGAASQYVRGDGTLADFPTSSGGGSSVSYYLNSSVSQGTIGGVAYRELSKDPIIGAGTDIAISADGYVASYITDANDPDVVIVPGGNFNCEFYFSVNNNTGNPNTYAELYKYDGTTFTLLGTSVGVPEYINQGTIIAPYYFAIPVPTSALAVTDRLAIRIYVSVDGRTVTLHTENSHLCQVVTTLSKGMVSLNNLTDQSQFLTVGTSGTNFAIVSSGDTHTFNLPVASATNTGKLSSTDWSTFNNKQPAGNYVTLDTTQTITAYKTFSSTFGTQFDYGIYSPLTSRFDEGILFLKGNTPAIFTDITTNLYSEATSNNLVIRDENSKAKLVFDNSTQTYTFPNASGTIALTSDLSGYVTLGTAQVITGSKIFGSSVSIITGSQASLSVLSSTGNSALILGYVNNVLKGTIDISATEFKLISAIDNILKFQSSTNFKASLIFSNTADYSYTYPNATGTIALTSNLSAYLPLAGGTLTGALNFTAGTNINLGTTDNYALFLRANSINILTLFPSGNAGINAGGSDTGEKFQVTGTTRLNGALSGTSATFSGALKVSISSSGATPSSAADDFIIESSGTSGMSILSGNTSFGTLYFGRASDAVAGRIEYNHSTNNMSLFTNGASQLSIASSGAATFSSSVTTNGNLINIRGGDTYLFFTENGVADKFLIGSSAGSNDLVFRSNAYNLSQGNERMRITSGGNVGIGTSSPQGVLSVKVGLYRQIDFVEENDSMTLKSTAPDGGYNLRTLTSTGNELYFRTGASSGTASTERMRIRADGVIFASSIYNTSISGTTRSVSVRDDGALGYVSSTRESKINISSLEDLEWVNKLNCVSFNYRKKDNDGNYTNDYYNSLNYGLIAEDVEKINKELVFYDIKEDGELKLAGVHYDKLIIPLLKMVQEQQAQIEELKAMIAAK